VSTAFEPVATALERELRNFYADSGHTISDADELTIRTNSELVASRADPIAGMVLRRLERTDLNGVEVLDVGCGFGALALYFAALGARVRGLDPHYERFEVAERVASAHGLDVSFDAGYIEDAGYADASFDVAVMNNSLCYIVERRHRAQALSQVRRVLRAGGIFVLRNPNRAHPIDQFSRVPLVALLPPRAAERVGSGLRGHRSRVRLTTIAGARRELEASGFAEVESHGFVRRPQLKPLRALARYHHQVAQKPG
jgi:2-polyprenyl-3-methyl-5-hydroxy-6-metoxy-1,4-benzoquinol methylase